MEKTLGLGLFSVWGIDFTFWVGYVYALDKMCAKVLYMYSSITFFDNKVTTLIHIHMKRYVTQYRDYNTERGFSIANSMINANISSSREGKLVIKNILS